MRRVALSLALLVACARPAPPTAAPDAEPDPFAALDGLLVPQLPNWTDRYAPTPADQPRFLRIPAIMERYGLDRLQAVEVQNQWRDALRAGDAPVAALDAAVQAVRDGRHESGLTPGELDDARFVVVFDLDETLLDQYYPAALGEGCHDLAVPSERGPRWVKLAPAWETLFAAVREAGGAVVLFSANLDQPTLDILRIWTWEGLPLLDHPDVAGVFTNSYLVVQEKQEDPKQPVLEPSKDLRMLDPTLERVIIVDDNPDRLFQLANARVTKKLHADDLCATDVDPALAAALTGELAAVTGELHEAVAWLDAHPGSTFRNAMLPYTVLGRLAVDAVATGNGWDREQAVDWVRAHPAAVDRRF